MSNPKDNPLRKQMLIDSLAWSMLITVWGLLALSHTNLARYRTLDSFPDCSYEWARGGACRVFEKKTCTI